MAKETKKIPKKRRFRISPRTLIRWGAVVVLVVGIVWLAAWLTQRSLMSQNKRRAMQSWLDEKLNADVSLLADIAVRINLFRRSRLTLPKVEVEHPNPLFSSKFARIGNLSAYAPSWSVFHVWPGTLSVVAEKMHMMFEQNESGDWSSEGLMNPLAVGETPFPFPMPRIKEWEAEFVDSSLTIRRRQYEAAVSLNARLSGTRDSNRITLRVGQLPFTFGMVEDEAKASGILGPGTIVARTGETLGASPQFVPGFCSGRLENIPARVLPFIFPGIPLDEVGGVFSGVARLVENPDAAGTLTLEGELRDVPLAVFGLPRQAPVRVDWPIKPGKDGLPATIRMGPSGFGAFTLAMNLDATGTPMSMMMRGDVASLDDMPSMFTSYSRWPDWLSRTFPTVEWSAGKWLGFGWSGTDMHLQLTRTMTGLNLAGEAEMMGGRIRIAMSPGQPDSPVTIAAERLDAQLLALKLSQLLPPEFRLQLSAGHANMSWRGRPDGTHSVIDWGAGLVFARPVFDMAASGAWWENLASVPNAVMAALPEWGGGDPAALRELSTTASIPVEQLSIVVEKGMDGAMFVEFRAYGEITGQATGIIEAYPNGLIEGELYLAGDSALVDAAAEANPALGLAMRLIAEESVGLRVLFTVNEDDGIVFRFPFLEDARQIHAALESEREGEP